MNDVSVKFGDSSLPWESSSEVQFGLPPQADGLPAPLPVTPPQGTPTAESPISEAAPLAESPVADRPSAPAEFSSFASFGGSSFASDTEAPVSAHAPATTAPRYVESPLFDEFDAAEDNEDLVFGNSGPVLESPLPGELSAPLTLPSFVEEYLKAEMEDDDQFEDFNEDDFDEEFDDDFEEEEDDFDYGEQELEEGVQESDDSGGDLGPDAVPDGDFED